MKKIKIKFVGYWDNYEYDRTVLFHTLNKFYDVELSDEPDYIICGIFGKLYDYCQYPQVRILDCGENYLPDFNLVDYALCRYPMTFQDRNFYLPGCISGDMISAERCRELETKSRDYTLDILKDKKYFANFMANHESEYGIRGDFFKALSKYKRVESLGDYLYNMPDGTKVRWWDDTKPNFQKKCKFTLCFESTKHEGFVTEKIMDAFYADTIPIYYGSSDVKNIFNEKAFIDYSDFDSPEAVIKKIIELDSDDEKYLEMLRQPIFNDPLFFTHTIEKYETFVRHVFDQPLENAFRRSRIFWPKTYDDYLAWIKNPMSTTQIPMKQLLWAIGVKIKHYFLRK